MVKVNYKLDAKNNGKFDVYTIIQKNFENLTKNTKDVGKYVCKKSKKILNKKNLSVILQNLKIKPKTPKTCGYIRKI